MIDDLFSNLFEEEKELYAKLMTAVCSGHLCIEDPKVPNLKPHPLVVADGHRLYLKRHWLDETRAVKHLKRLVGSISIITGGPGTGKTTMAKSLTQGQVVLTAPTGKAVARLKELNLPASCGTLHSILGIRSQRDFLKEGAYLPADVVIVDECSMIDAPLFAFLLASIMDGTRLILIGDANQLPAVGVGSFFADLVGLLPTTTLTTCRRSDQKEILDLAEAIKAGDAEKVVAQIQPWPDKIEEGCTILSCIRSGPFGVDTLNRTIKREPIPIIITRTDADLGIYNGETAILMKEYALFSGDRKIALAKLPPYEYAYALSVHKSQGSEFDHVVVVVPKGAEVFGREVLYTAVTRARFSVRLCGDPETIRQTVLHSSRKISGLRERLRS